MENAILKWCSAAHNVRTPLNARNELNVPCENEKPKSLKAKRKYRAKCDDDDDDDDEEERKKEKIRHSRDIIAVAWL